MVHMSMVEMKGQLLWEATTRLGSALESAGTPEALIVYNPISYAAVPMELYTRRYLALKDESKPHALILGMNPGPYGMAQTGVPFGDIPSVRDWMGIEAPVSKPPTELEKKPVLGFSHTRVEVSGKRLWGYMAAHWPSPEAFFQRHSVVNYNPLLYLEPGGRNFPADKLRGELAQKTRAVCDEALAGMIEIIAPDTLIGVGKFAQVCLERVQLQMGDSRVSPASVLCLPHPSPANPAANRGWDQLADSLFYGQGIWDRS